MAEKGLNLSQSARPQGFSIDADEVARFSALAEKWWDVTGEFAPLHRFNPTRVSFIREECLKHFGKSYRERAPFAGIRLLDVGCGGGLLSEPMSRMGFDVTGLDASEQNIGTARAHAAQSELPIRYLARTVEQLAEAEAASFDVVLCMEVIEHVSDPEAFLKAVASMVKPGGILFLATLNRTIKAHALAIVGAEYILNWVPRGTHDWNKFLSPDQLTGFLDGTTLRPEPAVGVSFNPFAQKWALSDDTDVNYMMIAKSPL